MEYTYHRTAAGVWELFDSSGRRVAKSTSQKYFKTRCAAFGVTFVPPPDAPTARVERELLKATWSDSRKEADAALHTASLAARRLRRAIDPAYREKINEEKRKHYHANLEKERARCRLTHKKVIPGLTKGDTVALDLPGGT